MEDTVSESPYLPCNLSSHLPVCMPSSFHRKMQLQFLSRKSPWKSGPTSVVIKQLSDCAVTVNSIAHALQGTYVCLMFARQYNYALSVGHQLSAIDHTCSCNLVQLGTGPEHETTTKRRPRLRSLRRYVLLVVVPVNTEVATRTWDCSPYEVSARCT